MIRAARTFSETRPRRLSPWHAEKTRVYVVFDRLITGEEASYGKVVNVYFCSSRSIPCILYRCTELPDVPQQGCFMEDVPRIITDAAVASEVIDKQLNISLSSLGQARNFYSTSPDSEP